jgi:serine/threonine-protein kinase RsbW
VNVDHDHGVTGEAGWHVPDLWLLAVPAVAGRLTTARHDVMCWSDMAGLRPGQVDDVALAVYEAMANVVDHAYPDSEGDFDLHATRDPVRVAVTVTDHGRWKPPPATLAPTSLRGRGLLLMRALAAELRITPRPRGTTVFMTWLLPRAARR